MVHSLIIVGATIISEIRAYNSHRHQLNSGTRTQYDDGPTLYNIQAKVKKNMKN